MQSFGNLAHEQAQYWRYMLSRIWEKERRKPRVLYRKITKCKRLGAIWYLILKNIFQYLNTKILSKKKKKVFGKSV